MNQANLNFRLMNGNKNNNHHDHNNKSNINRGNPNLSRKKKAKHYSSFPFIANSISGNVDPSK